MAILYSVDLQIFKNVAAEVGGYASIGPHTSTYTVPSFDGEYAADADPNSSFKFQGADTVNGMRAVTVFNAAVPNISHAYCAWNSWTNVGEETFFMPHDLGGLGDRAYAVGGIIDGGNFNIISSTLYTATTSASSGSLIAPIHPDRPMENLTAINMMMYKSTNWGADSTLGYSQIIWLDLLDITPPLYSVSVESLSIGSAMSRKLGGDMGSNSNGFDARKRFTITYESIDQTDKDELVTMFTEHKGGTYPFVIVEAKSTTMPGVHVVLFEGGMSVTESAAELYDVTFTARSI